MAIAQGKGGGVAAGGGGLTQGKGGGRPSVATRQTLPTNAAGKPVVRPPGGDLAGMFLNSGPVRDVKLAEVAQPTRPVLGSIAPGTTSHSAPPRPQVRAPTLPPGFREGRRGEWIAPDGSAYNKNGLQIRLPQMDGNGGMHNNAPVYGAPNYAPSVQSFLTMQQMLQAQRPPAQPSKAARLAAEINRRAAARR